MLKSLFTGIFDTDTAQIISVSDFLLCILVSLIIGTFLAVICNYKNRCTQSFKVTLAILPAVVCVIIMLVNGNVGTGVAVAGAFGLVRFRSVPGTAREIGSIFLAMGTGLAAGMGYLGYAVLFALIMGCVSFIYFYFGFGNSKIMAKKKMLTITIPEDLDYTSVFEDLLVTYTNAHQIVSVKTTNMGSLFKLTYDIELKALETEKTFIDELRCRNGNLEILLTHYHTEGYDL